MSGTTYIQIAAPQVTVNNVSVAIVPNTFKYTEGLGEQTVKAASPGGGAIVPVIGDNAETKISDCKFSVFSDGLDIANVLAWKQNPGLNVVTAVDPNNSGWQRTFQQATVVNNYEVGTGADGMIELEFKSRPCI